MIFKAVTALNGADSEPSFRGSEAFEWQDSMRAPSPDLPMNPFFLGIPMTAVHWTHEGHAPAETESSNAQIASTFAVAPKAIEGCVRLSHHTV